MTPSTEKEKPRVMWVLPHRDQTGEDTVIFKGQRARLSEVVEVRSLPKALVLGIPEEAVERDGDKDLIFAQFIRQPELDRAVFGVSICCGADRSGRVVFLTAIQFLGSGQSPSLSFDPSGLAPAEAACVSRLVARLKSGTDRWGKSVIHLLNVAGRKRGPLSFANISLPRSHYKPDWTPEKKKLRSSEPSSSSR
jgi:hypothetical protein